MKMWEDLWYGPVPAARASWLVRVTLLLLAFDACLLMLPHGGHYGAAGFNVAHFTWLDALQPHPSPGLYVALMLAVSVTALVQALAGPSRVLMCVLLLLYTYGWAMSVLDSYQHHYLLSLALLLFVFLVGAREGEDGPRWGFKLFGANLALVYAFAVVAKLEPAWLSGATLRVVGGRLGGWLAEAGIPAAGLWRPLAIATLFLEVLIAAAYWASLSSGAPGARPGASRLGSVAWLAALLLHGGIALQGLNIGWFSAYALAFASAFFLPRSWVQRLGAALSRLAWPIYRGAGTASAAVRAGQAVLGAGSLTAVGLL
ncbi:MAG: hypothetical protein L0Y64_03795, partial [Myxococcaceae bacterium]|nr:hypothetical protein [Myxococcaceae bacterium]